MTAPPAPGTGAHDSARHQHPAPHDGHGDHGGHGRYGRHRLMMIACCVPMLAIAAALVATGAISVSFLLFAIACTTLMFLMHGGSGQHTGHQ